MKHLVMVAAIGAALCTPALAGGSKNALNVGAVLSTGKGGLLGTLLGSNSGHGNTGLAAVVNVSTGKGGVLGLLTGSSKGNSGHGSGHGGW